MTDEIAKEVFDLLLDEYRRNGLTDIGTFMIDEIQKEFENEKFDDSYQYTDTEKTISNYEILSSQPQGSKVALQKLVDASIQYFSLVQSIPDRFNGLLSELSNEQTKVQINFSTITERDENVDKTLQNDSIMSLIKLLHRIRENFHKDDDTFLQSILK
jgi:hypothetical protein